jgi:hypothetical protein
VPITPIPGVAALTSPTLDVLTGFARTYAAAVWAHLLPARRAGEECLGLSLGFGNALNHLLGLVGVIYPILILSVVFSRVETRSPGATGPAAHSASNELADGAAQIPRSPVPTGDRMTRIHAGRMVFERLAISHDPKIPLLSEVNFARLSLIPQLSPFSPLSLRVSLQDF